MMGQRESKAEQCVIFFCDTFTNSNPEDVRMRLESVTKKLSPFGYKAQREREREGDESKFVDSLLVSSDGEPLSQEGISKIKKVLRAGGFFVTKVIVF